MTLPTGADRQNRMRQTYSTRIASESREVPARREVVASRVERVHKRSHESGGGSDGARVEAHIRVTIRTRLFG